MVFYYLEFAVLASLASLIPIHRQRMGWVAYTVELWRLYYMYKIFDVFSVFRHIINAVREAINSVP